MKFKSIIVCLLCFVANPSFASQTCTASWYGIGDGFQGKKTASGARFNTHGMMAAHRTLKFGSKVLVTNLNNNKSVRVVILDRGPFSGKGRCIDLSHAAKSAIGMGGTARVSLEVVK